MSEKKIAIVTDSSAYIPDSALQGLDVNVIPLWLLWEGESFRDGVDIDPAAFYQKLRQSKKLPTSSQPTVREFEEFFKAESTVRVQLETLDQFKCFIRLSAKRLHDSDQVINLNKASFLFVKHIENAPEVFNLFLRVLFEYVVLIFY